MRIVFDIANNVYISNDELIKVIKTLMRNNLNDTHFQKYVDKLILITDNDEDGNNNYEEL